MKTSETITHYQCDRCGRKIDGPHDERWATIFVQLDGPADDATFPIGVGHQDICPSCTASFRKWWKVVVKEPA
jgi:hypothetical protein